MKKVQYETLNRVSSASLEKHTGKNWDRWIAILHRAGAAHWSHREIADHLRDRHGLGMWWQQGIAMGYEIVIGKRVEGRNLKGEFSISVSRTFPLKRERLWHLLTSADGLALWLKPMSELEISPGVFFERQDGIFGQIRTLKTGERIRLVWQDGEMSKKSTVQLFLIARKNGKSVLALSHDGLVDGRLRAPLRAMWKQALDELIKLSEEFSSDGFESRESRSAAETRKSRRKSPRGNSVSRQAGSRKSAPPKRK